MWYSELCGRAAKGPFAVFYFASAPLAASLDNHISLRIPAKTCVLQQYKRLEESTNWKLWQFLLSSSTRSEAYRLIFGGGDYTPVNLRRFGSGALQGQNHGWDTQLHKWHTSVLGPCICPLGLYSGTSVPNRARRKRLYKINATCGCRERTAHFCTVHAHLYTPSIESSLPTVLVVRQSRIRNCTGNLTTCTI